MPPRLPSRARETGRVRLTRPPSVHPAADLGDQCDRAHLAEFGVTATVGRKGIEELLRVIDGSERQTGARCCARMSCRTGQPIAQSQKADRFWLACWLMRHGVEVYVVQPSSVPVDRRTRRAKSDGIDSELLLRTLLAWLRGEPRVCSMVPVPDEADELFQWQCAGCERPIGGLEAINLRDGNRVHFEPIDCMIEFGRRWRNEAKNVLVALGVRY
jgi:hypothetical protein